MTKQDFWGVNSLNKRIYLWIGGRCLSLTFSKFLSLADRIIFSVDGSSTDYVVRGDKIDYL